MAVTQTRLADHEAKLWEDYRIYQRDLLLSCFEDAQHMLRRLKGATDDDRRTVVSLLWEKRCQPWKFYRDEHLARLPR